jgi:hypothetical protein
MQGQLDEMKAQRLINIANSRANLVRKISVRATTEGGILAYVGESIIGFQINPDWQNHRSTKARAFRAWFDLKAFDIGPTRPQKLTDKDCPPESPFGCPGPK